MKERMKINKIVKVLAIGIALGSGLFAGSLLYNTAPYVQAANPSQPIVPQDYQIKVNKNGQTYGSLANVTVAGQEPDLVQALGIDGTEGYVKFSDLQGPSVNTPEEAKTYMEQKKGYRLIPLYTSDGETIIGLYKSGGSPNEMPSKEEVEKQINLYKEQGYEK